MLITIFITNILTGGEGVGLHFANTMYLLAVAFNVIIIMNTSSKLNNEDEQTLSYVPNLF